MTYTAISTTTTRDIGRMRYTVTARRFTASIDIERAFEAEPGVTDYEEFGTLQVEATDLQNAQDRANAMIEAFHTTFNTMANE